MAAPKPAPPAPKQTAPLQLKIPPILLEGDQPVVPAASPPRFSSEPVATPSAPVPEPEGELPEAYGTGRLFLMPRDPRCICAQWDLTAEQLRYHNGRAVGQHLVLRVYAGHLGGERVAELHVHPESRHWFVHVDRPGTMYVGDLGYYVEKGQWHSVAVSEPAATPAEASAPSSEPVRFAMFAAEPPVSTEIREPQQRPPIPVSAPVNFEQRQPAIPAPQAVPPPSIPAREGTPAPAGPERTEAEAPAPPIAAPAYGEPASQVESRLPLSAIRQAELTAAQEMALWELMGVTWERREWLNSAEIAQILGEVQARARAGAPAISSAEAAQLGLPAGLPAVSISSAGEAAPGEITSPAGGEVQPQRSFWFNVNAELIIYGATEPDARVTIGDRTIRLRPDGTFSYRFSLPDGNYSLPVAAIAAHGDQRRAELEFYRGTRYAGEVGAHPQDSDLKTPAPENVT